MSSPIIEFTRDQARTMLLAAQGFASSPVQPITEVEVLEAIRKMGVLQIDTISVVARSPYLVLWSRLGEYDPKLLDHLLATGKLFEYWSHEACFIPIEQYKWYRRFMLDKQKKKRFFEWLQLNEELAARVLGHVRVKGEVRSSDFERQDGRKGSWWDWKEEKVALEFLHTSGELMIRRRDKFQRIYDLRSRVHPSWEDGQASALQDAIREKILLSIRCLGVAKVDWISDYFRFKKGEVSPLLQGLVSDEQILPARIEGFESDAFVAGSNLELAQSVLAGRTEIKGSWLLSPFDPIVWDRKRALELFDFDYRIECYVPGPKRRYGYFVLPILVGNRLVGRLDAKAHRQTGLFEVKTLFLEDGEEPDMATLTLIAEAMTRCAKWHRLERIKIAHADRPKLAVALRKICSKMRA